MKTLPVEFWSILALIFSTAAFANEFGNLPQVREITSGQPKDVVALIERIAECNHWSDEEPYDKERADQIRKAVEKAKCGDLDSDKEALEEKYKSNNKVLEAIKKATELII
jgi:hypothetical protein